MTSEKVDDVPHSALCGSHLLRKGDLKKAEWKKKVTLLKGGGKSVMFQDHVFPYNKSFLEGSQKEVLGLTTA